MMMANFGILISFIAGYYLSFEMIPRIFIFVPIIFLVSLLFFPDTPFFFMKSSRPEVSHRGFQLS